MIGYNKCIQGGLNTVSIQLIQQAICYMEEHICENISYAVIDVAYKYGYKSPESFSKAYGLCSPVRGSQTHFNYGIGVVVDEDTDTEKLEHLI